MGTSMNQIQSLLNLSELRSIANNHDGVNLLLSIKDKLSFIIEEAREEEIVKIKQVAEKERKIKYYRELLCNDGIDPTELLPKKPILPSCDIKAKKEAKYMYYKNGTPKYWSGRGRIPYVINVALKSGGLITDFLISDVD